MSKEEEKIGKEKQDGAEESKNRRVKSTYIVKKRTARIGTIA
jgi:hypothetical protein